MEETAPRPDLDLLSQGGLGGLPGNDSALALFQGYKDAVPVGTIRFQLQRKTKGLSFQERDLGLTASEH